MFKETDPDGMSRSASISCSQRPGSDRRRCGRAEGSALVLVDDLKAQIEATPYCSSSCDWLEFPTSGCNKLGRRKKVDGSVVRCRRCEFGRLWQRSRLCRTNHGWSLLAPGLAKGRRFRQLPLLLRESSIQAPTQVLSTRDSLISFL